MHSQRHIHAKTLTQVKRQREREKERGRESKIDRERETDKFRGRQSDKRNKEGCGREVRGRDICNQRDE